MMSRFQNCHFEYNLNKYSWRKQGNTLLHSEQCRLYSGQVLEYDSVQLPLSIHYCLSSQFNHCQALGLRPSPISYLCHLPTFPLCLLSLTQVNLSLTPKISTLIVVCRIMFTLTLSSVKK